MDGWSESNKHRTFSQEPSVHIQLSNNTYPTGMILGSFKRSQSECLFYQTVKSSVSASVIDLKESEHTLFFVTAPISWKTQLIHTI